MTNQPTDETTELQPLRHSAAHVMAHAVLNLFPEAKIAIGPAIDHGFYYDFDLSRPLKAEDLEPIEAEMTKIINGRHEFCQRTVSRDEARALFKDQPYKLELIDSLPEGDPITVYTVGSFTDLCRGPHVRTTQSLNGKAIKLMSIAGAYWRGDEKRPMLQRIYGTAWKKPDELRAHLDHLAEIEKRDHRRIGRELDLFSLQDAAGPGLVYWHPKGARIRYEIESFWKAQHLDNGYEFVHTPHIGKSWLWETSGHLDFYQDSMYSPMELDKDDYYAKPMNCPFHIMIYQNSKHSYRDLPKRWAELGTVYRYEKAGALHGLMRVRGFTQDDAHIICTKEQIEGEIQRTLDFSLYMLRSFGFTEFKLYLSTRPDKAVGEPERWELAQQSLLKAIAASGLPYETDVGGGAFYGPKIDIKLTDAVGREWQLSTIQFDFNLPERFKMGYTAADGSEQRPFMVHRALLGSLERFFGVLIEHYAGAFPAWLCPVQAVVIPVAKTFDDAALALVDELKRAGVRAEADISDDRMNNKIRKHQGQKVPWQLILGGQEVEQGTVSVRHRDGSQVNGQSKADFLAMALGIIRDRS